MSLLIFIEVEIDENETIARKKADKIVILKRTRTYTKKLRERVIHLLGGECRRCGFKDFRALQIDHVHGSGAKELNKVGRHSYHLNVIKHIRNGGRDYQLLCANCNWIKRHENEEKKQTFS